MCLPCRGRAEFFFAELDAHNSKSCENAADNFEPLPVISIRFLKKRFRKAQNQQLLYSCRFKGFGQEWIRTTEGVSQRIYSLTFYSVIDDCGQFVDTFCREESEGRRFAIRHGDHSQ
jgi:hypothetical protein